MSEINYGSFPVKIRGVCPCGATVTTTGTRESFGGATVMAFCKNCDAHVAPTWDFPWSRPPVFTPWFQDTIYTTGVDMASGPDQSCAVMVRCNPDGSVEIVGEKGIPL